MRWSPPTLQHDRPLRDEAPESVWRFAMTHIAKQHELWPCELEPYTRGETVVYSAGEYVIKLTVPSCRYQIDSEVSCLPATHGKLSVATPELFAHGEISDWPYVIMSKIPGFALADVWPKLGHERRRQMARKLGLLCHELHALAPEGFPDGWPEFWRSVSRQVGARHATRGGPPSLLAAVDPFLGKIGELRAERVVPLHTELIDEHVYVEERGGELVPCGLLDFADARLGAPEYEFGALVEFVFRGERGLLREFLLGYGIEENRLTPEFSEVLLAWSLCHRFGHLGRMLALVEPEVPDSLEELAERLFCVSAE
jgi:hygromycin-B 7''-O-kinase